jgi:cytochrome c peroxidase
MFIPLLFALLVAAPPLGLDLYRPVPDDNPLTKDQVALGRKLFNDKRLSRDRTVACATCHVPNKAFTDGRTVAVGIEKRAGTRNVPTLINRAWGRVFFLDGRAPTLERQAIEPILNPLEMDLTLPEIKARVGLEPEEVTRALASYVRTIVAGNSPYDKFSNGDQKALSAQAKAGLAVFRGKGHCTTCHAGPNLTDERLHNTGVAWRDGALADLGAGQGNFKVPTLREVARTAPYMHDGSLRTLEDVVDYYDRGGNANSNLDEDIRPLHLTAEEKRALVAFLRSLSGDIREGKF